MKAHARTFIVGVLTLLAAIAPGRAQPDEAPLIAFASDFGLENEAVAVCKGMMFSILPHARIVDLTHRIPPFDIWEGAIVLRESTTFPPGTVFVAVIDPGVGTQRKAVAVKTRRDFYYVAPDNGLLTWVVKEQGVDAAVEIAPRMVNPRWRPGTFDGRDLFSPAAAHLARTAGNLAAIGTPMDAGRLTLLDIPGVRVGPSVIQGIVERADKPFGNVLTTVTARHVADAGIAFGDELQVTFGGGPSIRIPYVKTFSAVGAGYPLAYLDARARLAFAVNQGRFMERYHVDVRAPFTVEKSAAGEEP